MERVNYSEDSAEPIPQPQEATATIWHGCAADYPGTGQVQQAETEALQELGDRRAAADPSMTRLTKKSTAARD